MTDAPRPESATPTATRLAEFLVRAGAMLLSCACPSHRVEETLSDLACRGTTVCSFNFSTVPAGKRLVITHIAGYVDTGAGTLPNGFLQSSFGGSAYATLPFTGVRGPNSALGVRIFINHEVRAFFGAGENPRVTYHVNGSGDTMSGGALMMVSGYLVNLP